ncbi:PadR family transcriptional regulator [Paenibacillus tepidiphilus]|uniref:PadR family transcriptional regulator n=1 Tax=Paenibacillus tepidiphilus TaxID=2608683 RepID=UPI00123A2165|nr:helix-turn-helix transcriptional regulator [Paenibacillus tepidiphilus]
MARHASEDKIPKDTTFGAVIKVQQVIDFMALSELKKGTRFGKQIDQTILRSFNGVGVNDSYLAARLKVLAEKGHATSEWDKDNRFNRFYKITPSGEEYFEQLLRELPDRVDLAIRVYKQFEDILRKFE